MGETMPGPQTTIAAYRRNRRQPDIGTRLLAYEKYWGKYDRESHCCWCCGTDEPLEVHHIDGNPFNNDLSNLVAVCHDCHVQKHRRESINRRLSEMKAEAEGLSSA